MLRSVAVSAVVASAAAFSAPSAFMGKGVNTRAALGVFLAGAAAIPATAGAEVLTSYGRNGDADPNKQLKVGGVGMTSVQGTGQTAVRTSGFKKAVLGNSKMATSFPREGMNDDAISSVEKLTGKIMTNSAIDKSGIKTFEGKLGINPAFGGSSGIMTGAKIMTNSA